METTRSKYGPDHYEAIGAMASTFRKNPKLAQLAAWKRWHPEDFDDEGNLLRPISTKETD